MNFRSFISFILMITIILPQKTYTFTEEEVNALYGSLQQLEISDSTNQKIIENLNSQIYIYIQQSELDSLMIEDYKKQIEIQEEMIKTIKPKWYDNKYLWYVGGVLSMILPIWGLGQVNK